MEANSSEIKPKPTNDKPLKILPILLDVGFTIAIPLVLLALGGRLLDKHFGTTPLLLLTGMILAIIISTIIVYKKLSRYF